MNLTLSIALPDAGTPPVDVDVSAPPGTTASELQAVLAAEFGMASGWLQCPSGPVSDDALVGSPPLLHGACLSLVSRVVRRTTVGPRPTPLELAVVSGPDCGRRFPLQPGRNLLGRGAGSGLRVDDPSLSRTHAVLTVSADGVHIADAGSTNGMKVDGEQVPQGGTVLAPGQTLHAGHSLLQIRSPGVRPAAVEPDGLGYLLINRAPRVPTKTEPVTITLPTRPEPRRSARLPWVAMLLPLPVCAVLAVLMGPQLLLFALMTPVMMLGNAVSDRVTGRREYAGELAEFERASAAAAQNVIDACRREVAMRRVAFPDPVTILQTAQGPGSRLWERRRSDPDVLALRVGSGGVPSSVRIIDPSTGHEGTVPSLSDAPVIIDLDRARVLGLAGQHRAVAPLLRNILGQLTTLHSPRDLRLVVLAAEGASASEWDWLKLLPHCLDVTSLDDARCASVIAMLRPERDEPPSPHRPTGAAESSAAAIDSVMWSGARTALLLIGSRELRAQSGIAPLLSLSQGSQGGLRIIAVDVDRASLPLECQAVLALDSDGVTAHLDSPAHGGALRFTPDGCSDSWAEQVARAMASLKDNTPDSSTALPEVVRLADLHGTAVFDSESVAGKWTSSAGSTVAVLGRGTGGPFSVDLVKDGPHVLVGGTTGSGKSQLLQSLVISLALANRPEDLGFVLVDYKGGSAFSTCGNLPHTVGMVTDLDGHLAQRALRSLRAELSRRERLFANVAATDLDDYRAKAGEHDETLGRLVLVIDEFRALAEELPEFLEGMVRLASVGRSLGVHLVLATQRPGGIVSADIRANVNLRIALRFRDRVDSEDVIESPDAAVLEERHRGRALARSGGGRLTAFQTAWLGARDPQEEAAVLTVRRAGLPTWASAGPSPSDAPPGNASRQGPTDLDSVVTAICTAAALAGCALPRRPWHPPLPQAVPLDDLSPSRAPGSGDRVDGHAADRAPSGKVPVGVPWGLADDPPGQRQPVFCWNAAGGAGSGGHWVIGGAAGSGRTSALRTLAFAASRRHSPDHLHVYAIDSSSNALRALESLPHVGAVVPRADFPRVVRLVNRLSREVDRRHRLLTAAGFSSLDEWVASGDAHEGTRAWPPPYLLLLVDDWDLLWRDSEHHDHGQDAERLGGLLREGEQVGLRAVVTGDRSVLIGRSTAWATQRLVLRLADPGDAALVGLSRDTIPRHQPPGRGVVAGGGLEVQLAHLGGVPDAAAAARAIGDLAATLHEPVTNLPFPVATMPADVVTTQLTATARGLEFAVAGEDCSTIGLEFERHGRQILIAGPARSGKSTALVTLALAARRRGHHVAIVAPHGAGRGSERLAEHAIDVFGSDEAARLAVLGRDHSGLVVLVDDADQLLDTPVEAVLRAFRGTLDRTKGALICAANSVALASQFRGVAVEVGRHQTGLLLSPRTVADGDLLGIRVPRGTASHHPGRGFFACRGEAVEVQVARPPDPVGPTVNGGSALDVGELLADLALTESHHVDTADMAG